MKPTIIKAVDLCKTYLSDGVPLHAVRNVSIDILEGDFTVIMGSSGSGKTTLLYLLSGLDATTAGDVWFGGRKLDTSSERGMAALRRKGFGFVFQAINLVPHLTIHDNVSFPGYLIRGDRREVDERARKLLCSMGLRDQAARLPGRVSGGEQQRAAIARALINSPKVLFADEPTGNLNSAQGRNVLDVLTELNAGGQSVVMVTHDIKAAVRADRLLFLADGKITGDVSLGSFADGSGAEREQRVFSYLAERGF